MGKAIHAIHQLLNITKRGNTKIPRQDRKDVKWSFIFVPSEIYCMYIGDFKDSDLTHSIIILKCFSLGPNKLKTFKKQKCLIY